MREYHSILISDEFAVFFGASDRAEHVVVYAYENIDLLSALLAIFHQLILAYFLIVHKELLSS